MSGSDWTLGAIADLPAPPRFQRETTPSWLVSVCTWLGVRAPDLTRPFRYADLGCGAGFTAIAAAAAFPHAEFWGFDFNPACIETAASLAAKAGLTNIRFEERSLAELAAMRDGDLPAFDILVADRLLSVVSPEDQDHIVRFIGQRLRPGGLACLGYHAASGWTAFHPLQTLIRMLYEAGSEPADLALPGILDTIERYGTDGARYLAQNPAMLHRLGEWRGRKAEEVALEFMNREWHPATFADVVDRMAAAKCDFVGHAAFQGNIDAVSVPPKMLPLLEEAPSLRIRETMRDLAAAAQYRRDIFRRGLTWLPVAEHEARLDALCIAATATGPALVPAWPHPVEADPEIHGPLLDGLATGPLPLSHARTMGVLADCPIAETGNAFAMLIASGHAHPVLPAPLVSAAAPWVGRLNQAIAAAVGTGEEYGHLVSPLLGSAIEANVLEILAVGAVLDGCDAGDPAALTARIAADMTRGGRAVTGAEGPIEDAAEAAVALSGAVAAIVADRLPLFRSLGIVPA